MWNGSHNLLFQAFMEHVVGPMLGTRKADKGCALKEFMTDHNLELGLRVPLTSV